MKHHDLVDTVQGMWWVNGGGFCVFLVVHWKELLEQFDGGTIAYFDMLLALGVVGQSVVNTAHSVGLGAWMTPAIVESLAAKILHLETGLEPMYFLKLGLPDPQRPDF